MDQRVVKGTIERSTSPLGAPELLIGKPDGSCRYILDYWDLNKLTRIDPYPLPNIQETLSLSSARPSTLHSLTRGLWILASRYEFQRQEKNSISYTKRTLSVETHLHKLGEQRSGMAEDGRCHSCRHSGEILPCLYRWHHHLEGIPRWAHQRHKSCLYTS